MRRFAQIGNDRPLKWTVRLTVLSALVMVGILTLFYATEHKPLAMRFMRAANPMSAVLPWLTQNMRLTVFSARVYDFLVVVVMAFQGCIVGCTVDLIRWFRRRQSTPPRPNSR